MSNFTQKLQKHFYSLSDSLFASLTAGEELNLNLSGEESLFVRLNGNRVRQNTNVEQATLALTLQKDGRTTGKSRTLTGDLALDLQHFQELLSELRAETKVLPVDPNQVPFSNNGQTEEEFRGSLLATKDVVPAIVHAAEGLDLAGLYASGPVVRANRNSKGQSHWFATEVFFLDYSLYNGPKAAKGTYAGSAWSESAWAANLARTRSQLAILSKPTQKVPAGHYRTFLAPAAFSALAGMMSWGALSAASWKQGHSALKKLADGEAKLSPLVTIRENFSLGLSPRFNSLGEVAPAIVPLIERGELRVLLVSSRTAKEYGLKSNAAEAGEAARALEVLPGKLTEEKVLAEIGTGLYLSNLHYLNWSDPLTARITGMTRYACYWVEKGEVVGPIENLRWDESLYDALGGKLVALGATPEVEPVTDTYFKRGIGGMTAPGALIDRFTFTL